MDITLRELARSAAGADSFDALTRTLLTTLRSLCGLETVYMTRLDEDRLTQEILFAVNHEPARVAVVEGSVQDWRDTACRRSVADGVSYTQHADTLWGDAGFVQQHGVRTYLSEPVRGAEGDMFGTLCAISDRRVALDDDTKHVISLFARLLGHQYGRERLLTRARQDNADLSARLQTDALTGVANRPGLLAALDRARARAAREGTAVAVVFVDLDRFKTINDLYGHRVGDHFLVATAGRLVATARAGEVVARYGGDEFVAVCEGPHLDAQCLAALVERFRGATQGAYDLGSARFAYAGASVGGVLSSPHAPEDRDALIQRADDAMYAVKRTTGRRPASEVVRELERASA